MFPKTWDLTISPATYQMPFPAHAVWLRLRVNNETRETNKTTNPHLKKKIKSSSFCCSATLKWLSDIVYQSFRGQCSGHNLSCCVINLVSKPAGLMLSQIPPSTFHGCQRGTGATESGLLPRVEWTRAVCEVEVGAFEYHRRISPPHPHPLPSNRLETTFSAPTGNGEFVLPPTKIYIFWASLPFIDMNFNLRYDEECASWIGSALRVKEPFLNNPCLECWRLGLCDRSPSKCWQQTQT